MKHVNIFLETFISVYDNFSPKVKVEIKSQSLNSPWITKGIAESSKRMQKLYEKNLKTRTNDTETAYKLYNNLFQSIRRRSKQNYYSEKLLRLKYNSKKKKKMGSEERSDWNSDIKVIKLSSKNYR